MRKIYLSLWDSYASDILQHFENKEGSSVTLVILQFGTLKYYGRFGYVNNSFSVSKLFIDSNIDEIISFRNSLLQNSAASSSSIETSMLSGLFLSLYDEFVTKTEFNNIAEISVNEVKQVVIVGTVNLIPIDIPWFYEACKTCNRKVCKKPDEDETSLQNEGDKEPVYVCDTNNCKGKLIEVIQRLRIPLTVQDCTGNVLLTLFDREACKLLKRSSTFLIEKFLNGDCEGLYPDEFSVLLDRKFAFKSDITKFNVEHNHYFFGINKLTEDPNVINELQKKANMLEVEK